MRATNPGNKIGCNPEESRSITAKSYLGAAYDFSLAVASFKSMGDTALACVAADADRAAVSTMMQKRIGLADALQHMADDSPVFNLKGFWDEAKNTEDEVAQFILDPMRDELHNAIADAQVWAMGGTNGAAFHSNLKPAANIKEVLKGRSPDAYITKNKVFSDLTQNFKKQGGLFSMPVNDDTVKMANDLNTTLSTSYIEGLLVALYASNADSNDMNIKTHSTKRLPKTH